MVGDNGKGKANEEGEGHYGLIGAMCGNSAQLQQQPKSSIALRKIMRFQCN